jgi:hypothetical protein
MNIHSPTRPTPISRSVCCFAVMWVGLHAPAPIRAAAVVYGAAIYPWKGSPRWWVLSPDELPSAREPCGYGSVLEFGDDFVGEIEVRVESLNVVQILERVDKTQHFRGVRRVERHRDRSDLGHVSLINRNSRLF